MERSKFARHDEARLKSTHGGACDIHPADGVRDSKQATEVAAVQATIPGGVRPDGRFNYQTLATETDLLVHRFPGPWVRAAQLPELFCSWDLAYRCTRSGWLKPILQGKRRAIYRLVDVLQCMQRIESGELPPARPKRAP